MPIGTVIIAAQYQRVEIVMAPAATIANAGRGFRVLKSSPAIIAAPAIA